MAGGLKVSKSVVVAMEFEVPVGLQYLVELINRGIEIQAIVCIQREESPLQKKRFLERMGHTFTFLKMKDVLKYQPIPCYFVGDINAAETLNLFKSLDPDIVVQGDVGGIIKGDLIGLPRVGILNCHPGLLPQYRGCTCVEWALYNDDPVGTTCHFITEKIDWGEILIREVLPVEKGDTYQDIRRKSFYQCAEITARAVEMIIKDKYISGQIPFDEKTAKYYKPIDDEKLEAVQKKLIECRYKHYVK